LPVGRLLAFVGLLALPHVGLDVCSFALVVAVCFGRFVAWLLVGSLRLLWLVVVVVVGLVVGSLRCWFVIRFVAFDVVVVGLSLLF